MGAGRLRVLAGHGIAAIGVAALASACGQAPSTLSPAPSIVTPSSVPALGGLTFGAFPSTLDGTLALALCQQWAGLRGEYVARVKADDPFRLERWFSSAVWRPAFNANGPLRIDPAYGDISTAFGVATTGETAGISTARMLDRACAAAD
ncbi:MAG: hypothetical protein ACRDOI_14295 [Trebonia sp.]